MKELNIELVDGALARRKLRTVTGYIMENLEGAPRLEQMAAVARLSPSHFTRQFKAATGLAPHQYVIALKSVSNIKRI
jgi:AraC family transcriptional regulator